MSTKKNIISLDAFRLANQKGFPTIPDYDFTWVEIGRNEVIDKITTQKTLVNMLQAEKTSVAFGVRITQVLDHPDKMVALLELVTNILFDTYSAPKEPTQLLFGVLHDIMVETVTAENTTFEIRFELTKTIFGASVVISYDQSDWNERDTQSNRKTVKCFAVGESD